MTVMEQNASRTAALSLLLGNEQLPLLRILFTLFSFYNLYHLIPVRLCCRFI